MESELTGMCATKRTGNRRFVEEVELKNGVREKVPRPPIPALPDIPPEVRAERAREWLESLGQTPSDQRVQKLAPMVGRFSPGSTLGRIADDLVSHNRLPSRRNVEAVYLRKKATKQYLYRLGREKFTEISADSGIEETVLKRIDQHWEKFGKGPTWVEVAGFAGLMRAAAPGFIRELAKHKMVIFNESPRSLQAVDGRHTTGS